jgi:predicted component of type VI protein secretion system
MTTSMAETTSTAAFDEHDAPRGGADAGLVLVYATGWAEMPRGFLLAGNTHSIGREAGAGGFSIAQSAVSRMHAVVQRDGDDVRVKDLGSRNGTFVNGERVTSAPLRDGDDLRIGDAVFKYVARDARAHLAYGLDGSVARGAAPVGIAGAIGGLAMARVSPTASTSRDSSTRRSFACDSSDKSPISSSKSVPPCALRTRPS